MSKKQVFGLICVIAAVVMFFIPASGGPGPSPPGPDDSVVINDDVHQAFVSYERLWRKYRLQLADNLDSGELDTEAAVYAAIAEGGEPMRAIAFDKVNKREGEALSGKWSAAEHSKILRGYSNDVRN